MHDSRAPRVEQFVHYRLAMGSNTGGHERPAGPVRDGPDAAFRHPFTVLPPRLQNATFYR